MKKYVAIDIGGTALKYGLMDQNGSILEKNEIATESKLGGSNILNKVLAIVEEYVSKYPISGVAISSAGVVDPEKGEIIYSSDLIPSYARTNYKKAIKEKFGLNCEVENDVNCAGLAESVSGASKDTKCSVMLTIGTGIGGSFIINNTIYHGYSNCACEIGRMLIDGKPFELQAAASVLVRKISERKNESPELWNGRKVFELAKQGDAICNEEIEKMSDVLAKGLSNICYVINPEVIVLGGGIMADGDYIKEKLLESLSKYLTDIIFKNTRIEFAKHRNNAGMMGAFYNYIQRNS